MFLALFVFAVLSTGYVLSGALWRWESPSSSEEAGPLERASSWLLTALAIAVAVDWVLALTHLFTTTALVICSLVLIAASALVGRRQLAALSGDIRVSPATAAVVGVLLTPVVAWVTYAMWRGSAVFVADHDGLGYHMPKALLTVRAHGYGYFDGHLPAIPTFPMNHELLLADVIALTGTDAITEWVSVSMFVFLGVAGAGLVERWWGTGLHVLPAAVVTWGMPVALLHSGSHKNDLLFSACAITALSFGARWATTGGRAALVFTILGASLAGGTKVSGAFVVIATLPALLVRAIALYRARALPRPAAAVAWLAGAAVIAFFLGWAMYVMNYLHDGRLVDTYGGGYGAWHQVWMLPVLMLVRPFCGPAFVWVPWMQRYWFDPKHDLFFSTLGMTVAILTLSLPLALWRYRRAIASAERRTERLLGSLGAGILFVGIALAWVHPPFGFFVEHTRYFMFLAPVIAGWTVVPVVRELETRGHVWIARGAALVVTAAFSYEAIEAGRWDLYAPFSFLVKVVRDSEKYERVIPLSRGNAAPWVDRRAGPDDHIAYDGELTGWPYVLYGRELRRRVTFLHPRRGPVTIPDDVQWVVVDRAWNRFFNNPSFVDLGDWPNWFGRGAPTEEDFAVLRTVEQDPRFTLVFANPPTSQAVFARVRP